MSSILFGWFILTVRKECEKTAEDLFRNGIKACPYHAGQSDSERARVQEKWISDEYKVSVKTHPRQGALDQSMRSMLSVP